MNESQVMARLRHELLTAMYEGMPMALSFEERQVEVELPFLTRDKEWLVSTMQVQLDVLNHAGLVRSTTNGYRLTEEGKRDRQQAARFFSATTTPPEAA